MKKAQVDPTEWAARKKAQIERAKQLREDRKNATNENETFQPQLVARKGSSSSMNATMKAQDSLDQLATDLSQNDIPIRPMKNNPYQEEEPPLQMLPSPNSDALGRELKKHGNSFGSTTGQIPSGNNTQRAAKGQYQSKFLQQYEQDSNKSVGIAQQQQQQPETKPQKNPDDDFMNLLRSDGKSGGRGWNDDTAFGGFESTNNNSKTTTTKKPVGGRRAPNKQQNDDSYSSHLPPPATNNNNNQSNYYDERDLMHYSRSAGKGDSVNNPASSFHSGVSPRTAPTVNLGLTGGGARPSPRGDPPQVITQARNSLSLLKSKIKQSGGSTPGGGGTPSDSSVATNSKNNNNNSNNYDNNNGYEPTVASNNNNNNNARNGKIPSGSSNRQQPQQQQQQQNHRSNSKGSFNNIAGQDEDSD
jgi:hypothetical protein